MWYIGYFVRVSPCRFCLFHWFSLAIHHHSCLTFDLSSPYSYPYLISYVHKRNTCKSFLFESIVMFEHSPSRTLSSSIYQLLTNFFAVFHRQVRIDVDVLQKLIRWITNDTTIRARSKIPVAYTSKSDPNVSRIALHCKLSTLEIFPRLLFRWLGTQQLLNIYSDHMPKDQYTVRCLTFSSLKKIARFVLGDSKSFHTNLDGLPSIE